MAAKPSKANLKTIATKIPAVLGGALAEIWCRNTIPSDRGDHEDPCHVRGQSFCRYQMRNYPPLFLCYTLLPSSYIGQQAMLQVLGRVYSSDVIETKGGGTNFRLGIVNNG